MSTSEVSTNQLRRTAIERGVTPSFLPSNRDNHLTVGDFRLTDVDLLLTTRVRNVRFPPIADITNSADKSSYHWELFKMAVTRIVANLAAPDPMGLARVLRGSLSSTCHSTWVGSHF